MKSRSVLRHCLLGFIVLLIAGVRPAAANSSHARIVRLSLAQGDVRFTRSAGNDPLTDTKAVWETAVVNLPIQQGYVLATGNGRAEVEFENGANAYLDDNSMLEFYEMSLDDGARITQLVLRQGTASFYVHPAGGDVFSVTGGDFTAVADGRASFRVNNYDDGSSVSVDKGRISVQTKTKTVEVSKGQSVTVGVGDESTLALGAMPANDDFDAWVGARAESVTTATNSAMQYVSSPYYDAGFADLYTYGSWFNYSGFGYCWQPIGVGFGWSPFTFGEWAFAPGFGWSWVSSEPWGWLPYHFGGWFFSPIYGWVWVPNGIGIGTGRYWRPVTAVWVRSGSAVGLVPVHPNDVRGKTPINLAHGLIRTPGMGESAGTRIAVDAGERAKVMSRPPEGLLRNGLAAATPPAYVSRTVLAGTRGGGPVSVGHDSSIVYDAHEHKFVNSNSNPAASDEGLSLQGGNGKMRVGDKEVSGGRDAVRGGAVPAGTSAGVGAARIAPAPPRAMPQAPTVRVSPPPRSSGGGSWGSSGGGRSSGGSGAASGGGRAGGSSIGGGRSSGGSTGGGGRSH